MNKCLAQFVLFSLLAAWALAARPTDTVVTAPDGRDVVLHDDKTWEYLNPDAAANVESELDAIEEQHVFDPATDIDRESKAFVAEVANPALLMVTSRKPDRNSCGFGLTLENRLPFRIRNIVPQFLAYKADNVMYQRVFQAWSRIRPGNKQYKEIKFDGITCDEIAYIKVAGAGRCELGELTRFSSTDAECLAHIDVAESAIVKISEDITAAIGSE